MSSPLSLVFTGRPIANRLSTVLASLSLTSIVFVILTSQVGLYLWKKGVHSRDPFWIRGAVIFVWSVQALEFALSCHMTAMAHSDESTMSRVLIKECFKEWAIYIATCVTTETFVHAYFISRIYILTLVETNQSHMISIILYLMLILEGVFGFISILSFALSSPEESQIVVFVWSFPVWLGLSILLDISIAGSVCYLLKKDGPFVSMRLNLYCGIDFKVTMLLIGIDISLVTGITMALWAVAQLDPEHLLMCFPVGGIYALCFMANLIARESYFDQGQANDGDECFEIATETIVFATPGDGGKSEIPSEVN